VQQTGGSSVGRVWCISEPIQGLVDAGSPMGGCVGSCGRGQVSGPGLQAGSDTQESCECIKALAKCCGVSDGRAGQVGVSDGRAGRYMTYPQAASEHALHS
jgi:hypothetical protein